MSAEVTEFLKTYWPSIMSVVVAFLTLIIVFQIVGMNFTPVEDKHIEKVVTIESFDTEPSQEAIEKTNRGDLAKLHKICGDFSKRACKSASYCVLLGGKETEPRCVGGGRAGPTYHTADGKDIDYDYFYHKGSCYGNCPEEK